MTRLENAKGLVARKLADKSEKNRQAREAGHLRLRAAAVEAGKNPDEVRPPDWPAAGWELRKAEEAVCLPITTVELWEKEGFAVVEGKRWVAAPGGPPDQPNKKTHNFMQADAIVLKCNSGDVRYKVVHQPGKYYESDEAPVKADDNRYGKDPTRVDWFFHCQLESE